MTRRTVSISSVSVALLAVAFVSSIATDADADVSSWLTAGVGANELRGLGLHRDLVPSLRLATGMGTDPSHDWVLGGLFRSDTLLGHGTDLSFSVRLADHGFVNGQWGIAVDAGPLARFWEKNAYGATAALTLGGPWGLEAGLQAAIGNDALETYGCFLAIDLARLTVYRRSGVSYWKNSFPVYRPDEDAAR